MLWAGQCQGKQPLLCPICPRSAKTENYPISFYSEMEVCLSFPRFPAFAPTAAISVPPPWFCQVWDS